MSHLTTYNSNVLVNCKMFLLDEAAKELGYTLNHDRKKINTSYINTNVDAVFMKDGKSMPFGIVIKDNKVSIVGDYYMTGVTEKSFADALSQMYKKQDVLYQCRQQGWTVERNDITLDNKTQEIVIKASRFVV